ncbi:unnamed protein product [Effrenium voratum]|nr:unnamed protein product [Effrenium voratum]
MHDEFGTPAAYFAKISLVLPFVESHGRSGGGNGYDQHGLPCQRRPLCSLQLQGHCICFTCSPRLDLSTMRSVVSYSTCKIGQVVSWDDVSRGTVGGALSCWGANITDTYLKSKSGASLFTVRSDNWNEKLGVVRAEDVAVVAGSGGGPLQPVTLRTVLQQLGQFGSYAGLDSSADLSNPELDAKCSIRFQTTFIPVDGPDGCGKLEFATEAYNYNTMDDADPRNLVLLCTSQGMAVQQDGRGTKKLFHHAADDSGVIHRYWLEAEESRHHVGGEQRETAEERAVALARGKATSSVIGTRAMGQRFNVLMTIQVPLQQSRQPQKRLGGKGLGRGKGGFGGGMDSLDALFGMVKFKAAAPAQDFCLSRGERESFRPRRKLGHSSAARVSRGSEHDTWSGLTAKSAKRNPSEHVTVTVVIYNAVKGGVPSAGDVMAAIDDLESLYRACAETGKLADSTFDFMKEPLKVDDMMDISAKLAFQPPSVAVVGFDTFPTA